MEYNEDFKIIIRTYYENKMFKISRMRVPTDQLKYLQTHEVGKHL